MYGGEKVGSIGIKGEMTDDNDDKGVTTLIISDEQLGHLTLGGLECTGDSDSFIEKLGEPENVMGAEETSLIYSAI